MLTAIALVPAFANPWWLLEPSRFAPIDDGYVYLSRLFQTYDGLGAIRSPAELRKSLDGLSVAGRPPLKQLMTLPLLAAFGRSESAALVVNLGYSLLLVFSTYRLARHFADRRIALLATFTAATLPPIVWLSRMYVPYHTVPACVALVSWRCVELLRDRRAANVWWVGAATAFGLLHHPHAAWFTVLPAALAVLWSWFRGAGGAGILRDAYLWKGILPCAAVCGGLVMGWYLTVGYRLLHKLTLLSDLETFRGVKVLARGFPGIEASFWWYLRTAPATITNLLTLSAILGFTVWLWKGPVHGRWLAVSAILGYAIASLQNNLVWFVMAGLLPIVAVAAVAWLGHLHPVLKAGAAAVVLVLGLVNYALASFDLGDWGKTLVRQLSYPVKMQRQAFFAQVPEARNAAELEVLARTAGVLAADPRCLEKCGLLVSRTRAIGYARLGFYLIENHPELNVQVVNEGAREWGSQYRFSSLVGADYLLFPDAPQTPTLYHRITVEFLNRPDTFSDSHERIWTVAGPAAPPMTLARRLRRLTSDEIAAVIRELPLDERYKMQRFAVLAAALIAEGDYRKAEDQLRRELEHVGPSPGLAGRGVQIAVGYLQGEDVDRAGTLLGLLEELFPRDPRVRRLALRLDRERRQLELRSAVPPESRAGFPEAPRPTP